MPIIYLDKNENHYPHSPQVLGYLKNISADSISFYSSSADPLVQALSLAYNVPSESILLTHGGEALLKEAVSSIITPQDKVLLPEGGWAYYTEIVTLYQGHPLYFTLNKKSTTYEYPIEDIKQQLIEIKPKLCILASPNNPTGHILNRLQLLDILSVAQKTKTFIILDEAYYGFHTSDYHFNDLKEFSGLLIVRTMSKLFGLAGLRIGFGFYTKGWDTLAKNLYRYLGFSHLSSDIALQALSSSAHYDQNAKILIHERELLEDFFISFGFKVYKSLANFIFIELLKEIFIQSQIFFEKTQIRIKFFSANKEPWFQNCIRITVGLPQENQKVKEYFSQIMQNI